jgi:hypothetical protein
MSMLLSPELEVPVVKQRISKYTPDHPGELISRIPPKAYSGGSVVRYSEVHEVIAFQLLQTLELEWVMRLFVRLTF